MKTYGPVIVIPLLLLILIVGSITAIERTNNSDGALLPTEHKPLASPPKQRDTEPTEAPATPTPTPTGGGTVALVNGTVIDGTGAEPLVGGTVILQGDRILAVGHAAALPLPPEATVIDVTGQTVMPGIINAHVHYGFDTIVRRNFLTEGVTSVCDVGSSLRVLPNFERQRTVHNQPAARGFKAGPIITAPGGYPAHDLFPGWRYSVSTPEAAEAAVLDLLSRNVDMIKIALEPGDPRQPLPVLSPQIVQAIVRTAHAHNLPVRAHVRQLAMLAVALNAGVDGIDHVPIPFCLEAELRQMIEANGLDLAKQPRLRVQLDRMIDQGVILIPTLDINCYAIEHLPHVCVEERQVAIDFTLEIIRYVHDHGGLIALGNDYGNPNSFQHMPLREMELLVAAGFTPMEIIEAGTRHAAQICGQQDEIGTLEAGKVADVIVVAGDPLDDIEAMRHVVLVIKGGEIAYRAEPDLMP